MVPFVERNYNLVELGPRGTGKSHLFQQVSPYAHLISGGKATVARMFVNNASGQRGLVCQYDVVCFDEVSGVSFDQKDGVNIMKGYMESGEFSRGKESIRADGSIVLVGNFDVDVEHQQRVGHLFGPCRRRCGTTRPSWTASMLPAGLGRAQAQPDLFTESLRPGERLSLRVLEPAAGPEPGGVLQGRVQYLGRRLSGRDTQRRSTRRSAAC
jgi:ATP-dependent Lon protease